MAATPFWIPRNAAATEFTTSAIMGRLWPLYFPYLSAHKFGANLSRIGQDIPFCAFLQRRPPLSWISKKCHFGLLQCQYLPAYKIRCILITNWPIYALLCIFQNGGRCHLNFPKWHFGPLMTLVLPVSISIPNLVQIDQESAEIHLFCVFSKMAAAAILDLLFVDFGPPTMSQLLGSMLLPMA